MAELSRVSRDGKFIVVKSGDKYYQHAWALTAGANVTINEDSGSVKSFDTLSSATSSGSWRRPTAAEKGQITFMSNKSKKTYRVPSAVQENAKTILSSGSITRPLDLMHVMSLASGNPVSSETILWMKENFTAIEEQKNTFGGDAGKNWASKFNVETITAAGFVVEDTMDYYAQGDDEENPQYVNGLLAVDDGDNLYAWTEGDWFALPDSIDDYEAPSILEISDEDATALAAWIDSPEKIEEYFVLTDVDPEERNLVELAYSEIDWDEIDRLQALTADATGYSPAERSDNAQRQLRSNDGKFGGPQAEKSSTFSAPRARLEGDLPLTLDPAARIAEYIAAATGNKPAPEPQPEQDAPVVASTVPAILAAGEEVVPLDVPSEEPEIPSDDQPLYFAIVDPVDTTAVLDVVSISPDDAGQASAWRRDAGQWVAAPETLADLQGDTPPPVVELDSEQLIKNVLSQIDTHDSQTVPETQETTESIVASAFELASDAQEQRKKDAKKGIALADGSFPVRSVSDLQTALQAVGGSPSAEVKRHLKKRAKALNRNDLIPKDWKEASVFDDSHLSPLYGEYGEIIAMVAAGGNAETLRQYWSVGPGAAKIRWGTEGDLSRCNRQLSKYMPGRAWGYCQNLHQRIFGMSNAKRDNTVGQ